MARPTKGADHVMALSGTRESKRRAKLILDTISGTRSVNEACELLGISTSQFANLRTQFLQYGLAGLQPKAVGRPRRVPQEVQEELQALRDQVVGLQRENQVLKVQTEVSGLLRRRPPTRSKSVGATASTKAAPRQDAAPRAVPRPSADASSGS